MVGGSSHLFYWLSGLGGGCDKQREQPADKHVMGKKGATYGISSVLAGSVPDKD